MEGTEYAMGVSVKNERDDCRKAKMMQENNTRPVQKVSNLGPGKQSSVSNPPQNMPLVTPHT
jgi:hypothetical protein